VAPWARRADEAEQLGALVEHRRVGGVEVLGSNVVEGPVLVGQRRVAPTDEAEDLAVVDDRHHGPVAEPVDQPPGAGAGGHPGFGHLLIGHAEAPQVRDETSPSGGGVARAEVRVLGRVLTQAGGQVLLRPALRVAGLEERQRHPIHLEHPDGRDGGEVEAGGPDDLRLDRGVAGLERPHDRTGDRGQLQLQVDVLVDQVLRRRRGRRSVLTCCRWALDAGRAVAGPPFLPLLRGWCIGRGDEIVGCLQPVPRVPWEVGFVARVVVGRLLLQVFGQRGRVGQHGQPPHHGLAGVEIAVVGVVGAGRAQDVV